MGNTDINKSNEISILNAASEIDFEIIKNNLHSLLRERKKVSRYILKVRCSEYREKEMREYYDLLNQKIKLLLALS